MMLDAAEERCDTPGFGNPEHERPPPARIARPGRPGYYPGRGKRVLDIIGASVLLIVFAPLILVICVVIAFQRGPVLFGHRRVGRNGRNFYCLKFRTMVPDADARLDALLASDPVARQQWLTDHKLDPDPRVTRIGCFLRRSSLDELPQLLNVLRGDMSLVGPRPVTKAELQRYGDEAPFYLALRPGLTGEWQIGGRNDVSYARRVQMDADYARRFGFLGDLRILARTVLVVLGATGK